MFSNFPGRGTPVAIYARMSTDQQNPQSADDQIAMLRKAAEDRGWEVVFVEKDEAQSGARSDRPGFMRLAAAASDGAFSVVMVEGLERLSRDRVDTFSLYDRVFKPNGIRIYAHRGGAMIDDTAIMLMTWKAQEDLNQLKQQVKRGLDAAIDDGKLCGSVAYGYEKEVTLERPRGGRRIFQPHARNVRRIFTEYAGGRSPREIVAGLNADGIPSPRGKTWNAGVLLGNKAYGSGILRKTIYNGRYCWGQTKRVRRSDRGNRQFVEPGDRSAQKIVFVPELKIIEDDLFEAVQDRIAADAVGDVARIHSRRKPEYVFSGKVRCGVCGENYNVLSGSLGCVGRAHKGNGCTNSRRTKREDLENAVLTALHKRLLHEDLLEPCIREYREEIDRLAREQADTVKSAEDRLAKIEKESDNLFQQLGKFDASSPVAAKLRDKLEDLAVQEQAARNAVKSATRQLPAAKSAGEIVETLKRTLPRLQELLSSNDNEADRARVALRALVGEIVVSPYEDDDREDGRGAGAVLVTVTGQLSHLLEAASSRSGRVFLSCDGTETCQELAILRFRYSIVLSNESILERRGVVGDAVWIERAIRANARPVTHKELERLLLLVGGGEGEDRLDLRVRRATERLTKRGAVRRLKVGRDVAFVEAGDPRSDADLKVLLTVPAPLEPLAAPPEAGVVILGRG